MDVLQDSVSEIILVHLDEQHRPNRVLVPPAQLLVQLLHSPKNEAKMTWINENISTLLKHDLY